MKFTKIICSLLVAVLGLGALASCGEIEKEYGEPSDDDLTYIGLRINPEIELIADKDGKVLSASAINEDGEIVLSTISLEGKSVEEASAIFTRTAEELGYFTPDGERDTVYIDVKGSDPTEAVEILGKINKSIRDYFSNNGINGKVSLETLEKYAEKAEEWGLSIGHVKLVMRVLDANPEMSDAEVLKLSVKDWMKLIKGNKDEEKIAAGLKAAYREEIKSLKLEYARVFLFRAELEMLQEASLGDLSAEEKSAIKAQIAEKEAELKPLWDEYKTKLNDLKNEYKEASKEARAAYRLEAEKLREENKASK